MNYETLKDEVMEIGKAAVKANPNLLDSLESAIEVVAQSLASHLESVIENPLERLIVKTVVSHALPEVLDALKADLQQ